MQLVKIKRAFEKKIQEVLGVGFQISFENVAFTPDSNPYATCKLIPYDPENPTLGDGFYRERGNFTVVLYYPKNQGTVTALTKACEIQSAFYRGYSITEDDITVIVEGTPQIAGSMVINDRLAVPVIIEYFANVLR
jgi:Bacteriophage related domain of unknown function